MASARQTRQNQFIDLLAAEDLPLDDEYLMPERPSTPPPEPEAWLPPMGPVGLEIFHCEKKFMLAHGERASGKCVAVDTLLYTAKGLKRIGRLRPAVVGEDGVGTINESVVGFDGRGPKKAVASAFYQESNPAAIGIEYEHGARLLCSPRHPTWCARLENGRPVFQWLRADVVADLLKRGDVIYTPISFHPQRNAPSTSYQTVHHYSNRVDRELAERIAKVDDGKMSANRVARLARTTAHTVLAHRRSKPESWHTEITPQVAYAIGALTGDGGMSQGSVLFTNTDQPVVDELKRCLATIGTEVWHSQKITYRCGGARIASLIREVGLDCTSHHKTVPDCIVESGMEVIRAYLRGLFDTDGTVGKEGAGSYATVSERLARDVQSLLIAVGVFAVLRRKKRHWAIYCRGRDLVSLGLVHSVKAERARAASLRKANQNRYEFPEWIGQTMREVKSERFSAGGRFCRGRYVRDRSWHNQHRAIFNCRHIPSKETLAKFCVLLDASREFEDYTVAPHWVKIISASKATANLCDIQVPETESFYAAGLIHHNTYACMHKLVRHLYDHDGAMACITVVTRSSAILGGAWTKFQKVLHIWADAIGLQGEGKNGEFVFKMDDGRNRFCWIRNSHGGWSMAFLKSLQHAEHIKERVKGMEFSFFFFDELTETDDERYFTDTIQQLGRLPGIHPQQFLAACNPPDEGEDHWVHARFFQGFDDPHARAPKRSIDYGVFHLPMTENVFMDNREDYILTVLEACRNDPTAEDRLIRGLWVRKPTGTGVFAEYFRRELHVKGNMKTRQFIIPSGAVIDIGYDIGTANTGIVFEERLQTQKGEASSWFDEIILVGRYVPIPEVAPMLLEKMNYWCTRTGRPLHFNHIADAGSFDQMRPDGSYDARKLEECVREELRAHPDRYPALKHIVWENPGAPEAERTWRPHPVRLIPCPKPAGSVKSRVKMMLARLQAGLVVVSARCLKVIEMFENLQRKEDDAYDLEKNSRHKHAFDAATYPVYHYEMGGRGQRLTTGGETRLTTLAA